jgi:folate-dependent phosphoribosylglycinamide formyltransferase PurN
MSLNKAKNILLFIGDDVISHMFLNYFIPKVVNQNINPILIKVKTEKPKSFQYKEINRHYYYETKLLNNVVYPYFDDLDHNIQSQFLTSSPTYIAKQFNLTTIETDNVNDPDFIARIKKLDVVGAISVRCFQIFKKTIIDTINDKGFFCNSHPGILPYHKGVFCMMRGIVNNHKHLGWTLHEIDEGIDTGQIIKRIPIQTKTTNNPMVLYHQSVPLLADAWIEYIINHIAHGYVESYKQKLIGNYYTYPTESEINDWIKNNKLEKIDPKFMVSFYYDLFISQNTKYQSFAQDLKILLINKISQYETHINCEKLKPKPSLEKIAA